MVYDSNVTSYHVNPLSIVQAGALPQMCGYFRVATVDSSIRSHWHFNQVLSEAGLAPVYLLS